ncbi:hypothetical protein KKY_2364 [Pelagibacterium halotolerans B2]|uniref:EamA domain-containing protein n=2 Tax=Pelagibacterium TaxID=1082930 RepID=G4R8C9_PELHB|nr:hypothetical protein KKY_2364 [Pelagibacterium halotolerans B2]
MRDEAMADSTEIQHATIVKRHGRRLPQIVLALLAMLSFALSDVFAKMLVGDISAFQLARYRYLGAVLVLIPFIMIRPASLRSRAPGLQIMRGLLMFGATAMLISALALMPVAEATTLVFVSPIIVTLLSATLLGERIGMLRTACLLGSLGGVAMVARPDLIGPDPSMLLPFGSALCWAIAAILTRPTQARGDRFDTTLVYATLSGFAAVCIVAGRFEPPEAVLLPATLAMVACWLAGHAAVLAAYRLGRIADVAPISYSQIVWAVILGLAFFSEVLDALTLLGCGIVIVCGAIASRQSDVARP